MSADLHRAGPGDLHRLLPLVAAYHEFEGVRSTAAERRRGVEPLLAGSPLGEVWLIGPADAPVGYLAIGLGWSIEFGGPDAFVDEFFLVEEVRGKGMGGAALDAVADRLGRRGIVALHLEVARENGAARAFYARRGFEPRDRYMLMSRRL